MDAGFDIMQSRVATLSLPLVPQMDLHWRTLKKEGSPSECSQMALLTDSKTVGRLTFNLLTMLAFGGVR